MIRASYDRKWSSASLALPDRSRAPILLYRDIVHLQRNLSCPLCNIGGESQPLHTFVQPPDCCERSTSWQLVPSQAVLVCLPRLSRSDCGQPETSPWHSVRSDRAFIITKSFFHGSAQVIFLPILPTPLPTILTTTSPSSLASRIPHPLIPKVLKSLAS